MSFNVTIDVIDHKDQAYETTGDWGFIREPIEEGKQLGSMKPLKLWIKVSRTGDWRYEMLVALHEFVEALLCEHDGVYEDRVNAFDIEFEKERLPGDDSEPGDDPAAPYYYQHQIATVIEKLASLMLGVNWDAYSDANAVLNPKSSLHE